MTEKTYLLAAEALVVVLILFLATVRLESVPPLWWDEGWTLSVARNWVELGHYGRLQDGKLEPRGLEAGFPVTASVALSFRLFGVGAQQARFVAVLFALAALGLLYELACAFYNRSIGLATLTVTIFLNSTPDIQALLAGRQVLGEIPALAFLLGGYVCFMRAERQPFIYFPGAICLWAIALFTKLQAQPFWTLSLVIPFLFARLRQNWRRAGQIAVCLCGTVALYGCMQWLFAQQVRSTTVSGLTQVIALVFQKHTRVVVLAETLRFGIPTLLGLCWGLYSVFKRSGKLESQRDVAHLAFFILVGSWFAWYELLSLGWPRYMLPPAFLGSIFVAAMLSEWTKQFDLASTIQKAGSALKTLRFSREKVAALLSVILIATSLGQTVKILYGAYIVEADDSYKEVIRFLNDDTPAGALIETYESELFFLLNRRYHYPPDQVHVDLIRRNSLGERVKIDYDPLAADPDYLVVGPQSKFWDFYDPYLKTGEFRLLHDYSRYQIYQRVR